MNNFLKKFRVHLRRLAYAAMCLALALVLPFLTGQIPEIGKALSPMHIPVLLCGFICGPAWGLGVGAAAPLLRHILFSMPPLTTAIPMAFELSAYGMLPGLTSKLLPRKLPYIYISLLSAMLGGRILWGIAKYVITMAQAGSFTFVMFITGAFTEAIPGIVCQLVLVPITVTAMHRARLMPEDRI